eukprot:scaffold76402_cov33-Tisochrysis_lutea.AAC.4
MAPAGRSRRPARCIRAEAPEYCERATGSEPAACTRARRAGCSLVMTAMLPPASEGSHRWEVGWREGKTGGERERETTDRSFLSLES